MELTEKILAGMIDHTNLKPDTGIKDMEKLCNEAVEYGFHSVCVNPCNVRTAVNMLSGSDVQVCSVVGFPLGASRNIVKAAETAIAVAEGATEIDMVMNIGAFLDGELGYVADDISMVRKACRGLVLKVILETCFLKEEQIATICQTAVSQGADFVKTSTGMGPGGATVEAVRLMRDVVGPDIGVKAAGGISDYNTALAMIKAGADRIGASKSVAILRGLKK